MKKTTIGLITTISIGLMSCGNNTDVKVPETVTVNTVVSGETRSTVVHQVAISLELQQIFENDCSRQADTLGLLPGSPERAAFVDNCVSIKTSEFITAFLAFLNSQNPPSTP